MSTKTADERVGALLDDIHQSVDIGNLPQASRLVREAASLAPKDPKVKAALDLVQQKTGQSPFLRLCTSYLHNGNEKDGQEALDHVKQHSSLSDDEARHCAVLLLGYSKPHLDLLDLITGTLMSNNAPARKELATQFSSDPTEVFARLWNRGERSFSALASVLVDESVWPSTQAQSTAQMGACQLLIGKLMDAGLEHAEWALAAITRLLTTAPQNLPCLNDQDIFDVILSSLDIRNEQVVRGQATLATAKLLEVTKENGEKQLKLFVTSQIAKQHHENLIVAFSAAAAVFPIVSAVAASMFLTEGFVEEFARMVERNSAGHGKSHRLEQAALELLSAACVDKACREAISKHCTPWLRDIAETSDEAEMAALAVLVLAKMSDASGLSAEVDANDLSASLANMALNAANDTERQTSVEGLAYTSLQPKIKESIASNSKLLRLLVDTLKNQTTNNPSIFGALNVFANLTAYRPTVTEEHKRMSELRAYANSSKPAAEDPLDDDQHVSARCRKVLDAGVVPALPSLAKLGSITLLNLTIQILFALSKEQKHRGLMAQQGAAKLLLQCISKLSAESKDSIPEFQAPHRTACHALARILISVNPSHLFSAAMPATSPLRPLTSLLISDPTAEQRDLLPVFESLLALTNLASMEDDTVRETILRTAWPQIEDLLLASNRLVQRAAVELVCNLMLSPAGVAKFADGSKQAGNRLHMLLALADVEDLATRKAAGGALAMLTEWDAAVEAVLSKERGVGILLGMCEDENEEIVHRGLVCVLNVVSAPGEAGRKGVVAVKEGKGVEVLKTALRKSRNREVLSVGVEALKKLT